MATGHFIWTDLSTFDLGLARGDYASIFGWDFGNDDSYDFAQRHGREVAAVFAMPASLVARNMPSFWMSYVQVVDLEETRAKARAHDGVAIETEPMAFGAAARIALIRDPSGAGFTLYEGAEMGGSRSGVGTVGGRYYHGPDVSSVAGFYEDLFGWRAAPATPSPWPVFDVLHPDGTRIARAEEIPDGLRGAFRYWMP